LDGQISSDSTDYQNIFSHLDGIICPLAWYLKRCQTAQDARHATQKLRYIYTRCIC